MNFREYDKFVKAQEVKGYENGFSFDDFKKGEEVWFFYQTCPAKEPVLVKGKVHKLIKMNNAKGEDKIRQIEVVTDVSIVIHSMSGVQQIKNHLFKPEVIAQPEKSEEAQEVVVDGNVETLVVERAMSEKNPIVKKHLSEGWAFKCREWSGEKNMYLATLERAVQ
jgi:hypothetical protein